MLIDIYPIQTRIETWSSVLRATSLLQPVNSPGMLMGSSRALACDGFCATGLAARAFLKLETIVGRMAF